MVKDIQNLPAVCPSVDVEETEDPQAFESMLHEVSKIFSTRDITEEFVACNCWPVKSGWSITSWKENLGKVPIPDFGSCFRLTKEGMRYFAFSLLLRILQPSILA